MEEKEVYDSAIRIFGRNNQIDVAIEEMAELTQQLIKVKRGISIESDIIEELADVQIMLDQMKILFCPVGSFESMKKMKINKLKFLTELKGEKNDGI